VSKADASISCDATANASDAAADLHGPVVPVGEATAATLAPERSFGQKAASGMTWLALQTIGYKIISFFGQVLLTYMIVPEDSAQINLALGVAAFTNFLQQPGLREVLVQRRSRSARWDEIGLWFSVSLGIVAALLTIAAGPIAAWWFQSPNVAYLLFILALAAPLTGLGTVPEARLQCEMRFKLLSWSSSSARPRCWPSPSGSLHLGGGHMRLRFRCRLWPRFGRFCSGVRRGRRSRGACTCGAGSSS